MFYPTFTKTFIYPTNNSPPSLSYQTLPNSPYPYRREMGISMVE